MKVYGFKILLLSLNLFIYKRYVDDIFVLFRSEDNVAKFKTFLNSCHPNMNFTSDKEENNCFPFLDIHIFKKHGFITSVYRKPMFSGVYTHFSSFIPDSYKLGLIFGILYHCFSICSDLALFYKEVMRLKDILE